MNGKKKRRSAEPAGEAPLRACPLSELSSPSGSCDAHDDVGGESGRVSDEALVHGREAFLEHPAAGFVLKRVLKRVGDRIGLAEELQELGQERFAGAGGPEGKRSG